MTAVVEGRCAMYLEAMTDGDTQNAIEGGGYVMHREFVRGIATLMRNVQALELAKYETAIFRMRLKMNIRVKFDG